MTSLRVRLLVPVVLALLPALALAADGVALRVLGAVGALSLGAAWYLGDRLILRRVRALKRAARRLGRLDLTARTGLPHGDDEIGALAEAIDQMAQRLERTARQQELVLESAGEAICGLDEQGYLLFANPAALDLMRVDTLPADPILEILPEAAPALRRTLGEGTLETGCEVALHRGDGGVVPVDFSSAPMRQNGHVSGAVLVMRDVADRKLHELELERAHGRALRAEQRNKSFSQEVLQAVTGGRFHLVDPEEVPTEGRPVMDLSLVEEESYAEVRRRLGPLAMEAGLSRDQAEDLVLAFGEAATNAIKHGRDGRCQVFLEEDRVVVRVSDRGCGIRPEDLPRTLFESGFSTKVSLGMGYTLMLQLADAIWLATSPAGTVVQIEKRAVPVSRQEDALAALLDRF